ncbi:hypothetical protein [Pedobacter sp. SYSU D00535]|uniref:hypothetical protein n=1 Tax=Pedobacter sp. SYSU D00535 TaxID=2810308 RepID=UPI001A9786C8|nr:hypothetical protein [Pedobacter sp. SYSU D00535]
MRRTTVKLAALFIIFFNLACSKEDAELEEADTFLHGSLDSSFNAKSEIIELDLNKDKQTDFRFYTETINGDHETIEAFLIESVEENKIVLANNTYNYSFHCRDLVSLQPGQLVSTETGSANSWDKVKGLLAVRYLSENVSFSGKWSDEQEKTIGVRVESNGKINYGWIRLQFNRTRNMMMIKDYALNGLYGKPIKAGEL